MVLFQPKRPEVPKWIPTEPGGRNGLLEGDRNGQNNLVGREERGDKKGTGFLYRKSSEGNENELDYARVSPHSLIQENWKLQGTTIQQIRTQHFDYSIFFINGCFFFFFLAGRLGFVSDL